LSTAASGEHEPRKRFPSTFRNLSDSLSHLYSTLQTTASMYARYQPHAFTFLSPSRTQPSQHSSLSTTASDPLFFPSLPHRFVHQLLLARDYLRSPTWLTTTIKLEHLTLLRTSSLRETRSSQTTNQKVW